MYTAGRDGYGSSTEMSEESATNLSGKPPCRYGSNCYRKNPTHFEQFSHPGRDVGDVASISCICMVKVVTLQDLYSTESVTAGPEDLTTTKPEDKEATDPPNPKRLKLDEDDVIVLDGPSAVGGASVTQTSSDDDMVEVRRKPQSASVKPLFYLTKVRGIEARHNSPNVAIGIKGKWTCATSACRGVDVTTILICWYFRYSLSING